MSFSSPRIPSVYAALDSAAFARSGGPAYGALLLDSIAQAHNRLQAAAAHAFALPLPQQTYSYGELLVESYWTPLSSRWQPVMHPLTYVRKPGHSRAEFRAEVGISVQDRDVIFQLATEAAPFTETPDTAASNVVEAVGDGTRWQTVSFNDVPITDARVGTVALYARTTEAGIAVTGLGTPTSGSVLSVTGLGVGAPQRILCQHATPSSDIAWQTTADDAPDDFASRGHAVILTSPTGAVHVYPIEEVAVRPAGSTPSGVGARGELYVRGVPQSVWDAINNRPSGTLWTFEITDQPRLSLASVSGAVAERS